MDKHKSIKMYVGLFFIVNKGKILKILKNITSIKIY